MRFGRTGLCTEGHAQCQRCDTSLQRDRCPAAARQTRLGRSVPLSHVLVSPARERTATPGPRSVDSGARARPARALPSPLDRDVEHVPPLHGPRPAARPDLGVGPGALHGVHDLQRGQAHGCRGGSGNEPKNPSQGQTAAAPRWQQPAPRGRGPGRRGPRGRRSECNF